MPALIAQVPAAEAAPLRRFAGSPRWSAPRAAGVALSPPLGQTGALRGQRVDLKQRLACPCGHDFRSVRPEGSLAQPGGSSGRGRPLKPSAAAPGVAVSGRPRRSTLALGNGRTEAWLR